VNAAPGVSVHRTLFLLNFAVLAHANQQIYVTLATENEKSNYFTLFVFIHLATLQKSQ
jgi:hypothetical protein